MNSSPIVLFDGVCNLCNGAVDFIIKRDPHRHFRFASLQSPAGQELLATHGVNSELSTMVLIENEKAYVRSAAALRIARRLPFPWPLLSVFLIVPAPLRDAAYAFVAHRRYRWFGKKETCRLPSPEERGLFLENSR